jgi:hypothetical protein
MLTPETQLDAGQLATGPILARMQQIEGWLEDDEADVLIASAVAALTTLPAPHALVEVGSYCGRSTVVLGSVVKTLSPDGWLYAIDPHQGEVGASGQGIYITPPTLEKLKRNLAGAGLTDVVTIIPKHSWEVEWDQSTDGPISFLFIDGLHDYSNVARDFHHFATRLRRGAYVAFHDYGEDYPDVKAFVDGLLRTGFVQQVCRAGNMMVVRRI